MGLCSYCNDATSAVHSANNLFYRLLQLTKCDIVALQIHPNDLSQVQQPLTPCAPPPRLQTLPSLPSCPNIVEYFQSPRLAICGGRDTASTLEMEWVVRGGDYKQDHSLGEQYVGSKWIYE